MREFNRRFVQRTADRLGEQQDIAGRMMEAERNFQTLSKLLITDSRGQHKDNLSEARMIAAGVVSDEEMERRHARRAGGGKRKAPAPHGMEDAEYRDMPLPPVSQVPEQAFSPEDILNEY